MNDLPMIDYPIVKLPIPSLKITVKARPFTVREEKLLLMAANGKDNNEIIETTKQVINNCILERDKFDVSKLPFFDIDYMFITLRSKSISEKIDMEYRCKNRKDDRECGAVFPVTIDLSEVRLIETGLSDKIELSSKLGVKMRHPSYSEMKRVDTLNDEIGLLLACIEYIYTDTTTYTWKDYSKEQFKEFLEKLTVDQYSKISLWVSKFPSFEINTSGVCPSCGFRHSISFRDFQSFFR